MRGDDEELSARLSTYDLAFKMQTEAPATFDLSNEPDHVSAYALIVEEGTALARQVRRGEVQMTDDDDCDDN